MCHRSPYIDRGYSGLVARLSSQSIHEERDSFNHAGISVALNSTRLNMQLCDVWTRRLVVPAHSGWKVSDILTMSSFKRRSPLQRIQTSRLLISFTATEKDCLRQSCTSRTESETGHVDRFLQATMNSCTTTLVVAQ